MAADVFDSSEIIGSRIRPEHSSKRMTFFSTAIDSFVNPRCRIVDGVILSMRAILAVKVTVD